MKTTRKQLRKLIRESIEQNQIPRVFMHVTAPSGCGKTTLMEKLASEYPQYEFFDLDEFQDQASERLGWKDDWKARSWSIEKAKKHKAETNKTIYDFVQNSLKPIAFFGIHHETDMGVVKIQSLFRAQNKIILDLDPDICVDRKMNRDYESAKVNPDGSVFIGGTTIEKEWTVPGIDIKDPYIIELIKDALHEGNQRFINQASELGYQPVDEIGIRTLLTQGLHDSYSNASINEGYFTDYAKHSTMNLGQVLRHLRYITDLPNTPKLEALKKRLRWLVNDLYYTITPGQWHHTQGELDELSQFSYSDLLKMGFDPDFAEEMLSNASIE